MLTNHYLVPAQMEGIQQDIMQNLVADNTEAAEDFFVDAKERLLDVNNWKRYSAIEDVAFNLTDSHGNAIMRCARKGDHIRMDLPGSSHGFDWVSIEAIEYDDYPDVNIETFAMRVRNCLNPVYKKEADPGQPGEGATGTFVIERRGRNIISGYHGRNGHEDSGPGNIYSRPGIETLNANTTLGLTDIQCTALVKGFLF